MQELVELGGKTVKHKHRDDHLNRLLRARIVADQINRRKPKQVKWVIAFPESIIQAWWNKLRGRNRGGRIIELEPAINPQPKALTWVDQMLVHGQPMLMPLLCDTRTLACPIILDEHVLLLSEGGHDRSSLSGGMKPACLHYPRASGSRSTSRSLLQPTS